MSANNTTGGSVGGDDRHLLTSPSRAHRTRSTSRLNSSSGHHRSSIAGGSGSQHSRSSNISNNANSERNERTQRGHLVPTSRTELSERASRRASASTASNYMQEDSLHDMEVRGGSSYTSAMHTLSHMRNSAAPSAASTAFTGSSASAALAGFVKPRDIASHGRGSPLQSPDSSKLLRTRKSSGSLSNMSLSRSRRSQGSRSFHNRSNAALRGSSLLGDESGSSNSSTRSGGNFQWGQPQSRGASAATPTKRLPSRIKSGPPASIMATAYENTTTGNSPDAHRASPLSSRSHSRILSSAQDEPSAGNMSSWNAPLQRPSQFSTSTAIVARQFLEDTDDTTTRSDTAPLFLLSRTSSGQQDPIMVDPLVDDDFSRRPARALDSEWNPEPQRLRWQQEESRYFQERRQGQQGQQQDSKSSRMFPQRPDLRQVDQTVNLVSYRLDSCIARKSDRRGIPWCILGTDLASKRP
jgi:hypothetical protein